MEFYYNPLDLTCKSIRGATHKSEQLDIFVKTNVIGECLLVLRRDDWTNAISYPMQKASGGFFVRLIGLEKGIYWYYFSFCGIAFGCGKNLLAEIDSTNAYQLSICEDEFNTPDWLKGGIIYQIFPDRFYKTKEEFEVGNGKEAVFEWSKQPTYRNSNGEVFNNEFFGGTIDGICEKLDYFKELGVSCLYLNPISKAFSSHRYDTGDYLTVDELLGDWSSVKNLCKKAETLGIKLVFDGVYNHVGADSIYFNKFGNYNALGAFNSKASEYYEWFDFEEFPNKYKCWWDFENLPVIKKQSKEFQNFICEKVIPKYIENGFCGVRLDVVDELDEDFIKLIRNSIKNNNIDGFVIGEVWEDASNKIAYGERRRYFCEGELDSVMNYPLKDAIICFLLSGNVEELHKVVLEQLNNYPKCVLDILMNPLSTHDSPRIITVLGRKNVITDKDIMKFERLDEGEYEKGKKIAKCAYALVFTLYGVPSVYYGDEVGLSGNLDPYNRKTYPWGNEDKNLLEFFKRLAKIRRENSVFCSGETNVLYSEDGIFIFERTNSFEQIIVAVSKRESDVFLNFTEPMFDEYKNVSVGNKVTLRKDEFLILTKENKL